MENKSLSQLEIPLKLACTGFIILILLGYAVALLQVYDRSHFDMQETVLQYRGDESGDSEGLFVPKTYASILSVTHVHSFAQPMMFGLLAIIFCFARASNMFKSLFIVLLYMGCLLSNMTPWLLTYVSASFVHLYPISQLMIGVSMAVMSGLSLLQMWRVKV